MDENLDPNADVAALYGRLGPIIYSHCRRLLKDETLAEDALQEVFVRVLRHFERAPEPAALLAWVRRIATNHCLNVLRDRARQAEPVEQVPEAAGDHPEPAIIDRDLANALVKRAGEPLRAPVVLHFVDELKHREVAAALGVSPRTVMYRVQEFAERSRQLLAQEWAAL